MAWFDVHRVRGGLALDCQVGLLSHMPTRFVVPVEPLHPSLAISAQLNPHFTIGGETLLMVTQLPAPFACAISAQRSARLPTIPIDWQFKVRSIC